MSGPGGSRGCPNSQRRRRTVGAPRASDRPAWFSWSSGARTFFLCEAGASGGLLRRRSRRIVERNGAKAFEWDWEQLQYIAEIARRLPKEDAARVAKDFWSRGIKDRRGRLLGQQVPRPKPQEVALVEILAKGRRRYRSPYVSFHRVAAWFRKMARTGQLPAEFNCLGEVVAQGLVPDAFRGTPEPEPEPGPSDGTTLRERERAEANARQRAERLARWRGESGSGAN